MSVFEINILPFRILKDQVEISFSKAEKESYLRIYYKDLPKNYPANINGPLENFAWWTITPQEGDITVVTPKNWTQNRL